MASVDPGSEKKKTPKGVGTIDSFFFMKKKKTGKEPKQCEKQPLKTAPDADTPINVSEKTDEVLKLYQHSTNRSLSFDGTVAMSEHKRKQQLENLNKSRSESQEKAKEMESQKLSANTETLEKISADKNDERSLDAAANTSSTANTPTSEDPACSQTTKTVDGVRVTNTQIANSESITPQHTDSEKPNKEEEKEKEMGLEDANSPRRSRKKRKCNETADTQQNVTSKKIKANKQKKTKKVAKSSSKKTVQDSPEIGQSAEDANMEPSNEKKQQTEAKPKKRKLSEAELEEREKQQERKKKEKLEKELEKEKKKAQREAERLEKEAKKKEELAKKEELRRIKEEKRKEELLKKETEKKKKEIERVQKEEEKKRKLAEDKLKKEEERKKKEEEKQKRQAQIEAEKLRKKGVFSKKQTKAFTSFFKPVQSAEKKSTKPENKEAAPKLLTGSDVVKLLDEVMDGEKHTEAADLLLRHKRRWTKQRFPVISNASQKKPVLKILMFKEDLRPPYIGTFRKKSTTVTGRRPFGRDKVMDYEYDSEAEWTDEEEGEELKSDDEDEEANDQVEDPDQDKFFVPDGKLSDDEGIDDEVDRNKNPDTGKNPSSKPNKVGPTMIIGCKWGRDALLCPDMSDFKMHTFIAVPINLNEKDERRCRTDVPTELMPDLIRLVHGSVEGAEKLTADFCDKHENLTKTAVMRTIKDKNFAVRESREQYRSKRRFVCVNVLKEYKLEELPLPDPDVKLATAKAESGAPAGIDIAKAFKFQAEHTTPLSAWTVHLDPKSKFKYFFNTLTHQRQWRKPPGWIEQSQDVMN
eukprot:m.95526 g.95526  ORF g.95526 m.95526 type:complete len:809 (-) comp13497_c0_seq1:127-2553(-)